MKEQNLYNQVAWIYKILFFVDVEHLLLLENEGFGYEDNSQVKNKQEMGEIRKLLNCLNDNAKSTITCCQMVKNMCATKEMVTADALLDATTMLAVQNKFVG